MNEAIQIGLGGVLQGCIYALLAVGFSLVFRVTGVINLAQGGFCILGALLAHTFETAWGWPILAAGPAAVLVTTMVGTILGAVAFVPGMRRVSNSNMLMLSAGLLALLGGGMLVIWGSQPYALPPFSGVASVAIAGIQVPTQGFWVLGTTAAIVTGLWLLLQRSPVGRALRACAENPTAAALMGISVPGMTLFSFALASAIGAIAGIVIAPATSLQFDTGTLFTISGFIAVAIGGIGSFPGAIAGGLLLGLASQFATAYISSLFSNALSLGLLLAVLLWRPIGLFATGKARRQDVREEPRVHKGIIRLGGKAAWSWTALGLLVAAGLPWVLPEGSLLGSLVIAGILFIAVMGLNVLMGYAGQVSLGQAGFMAIGGYTAGWLAVQYEVPPLLGLLAGIGVSLVCALLLALITMRLRGLYLALATLAFGLLVDSLAVGLDEITGGPSGLVGIPPFTVGPLDFGTPLRMYYLVLGVIAVSLALLAGAMRSDFGRTLQAIRTDQTAAAALGVNVPFYKLAAFAISAVFASIAGSLYAFDFNFLAPEMVGTSRSLELVTMMIIGGEGTLVGPLFGAGLLTLLPTAFQALSIYKTFANGALLVAFFLYLPEGMFGGLVRLAGALGRRVPGPPNGRALAKRGLT
jgi:branched-chain amino acid transport system permease protein